MWAVAVVVVAGMLAACGDEETPASPAAKKQPAEVDAVTCAEIRTKAQALRIARRIDHRVVAPDGQSRRETLAVIGGSLYATCRNPNLRRYKPVKPVLREVQAHFDEEALEGEHR